MMQSIIYSRFTLLIIHF